MALGETIGYSTRLTQNNISLYAPSDKARQIHIALMGDPTLRMHIVLPPSNLESEQIGQTARLTWNTSSDSIEGYHIFRSDSLQGAFSRLTTDMITDTVFVDPSPLDGNNIYMVRALKLETSASGTYYNLSQGILDSIHVSATNIEPSDNQALPSHALLQNYPNPFNPSTTIRFSIPERTEVSLAIYNITGQLVKKLLGQEMRPGYHSAVWNGRVAHGAPVGSGVYFFKLITEGGFAESRAMVLLR